MQARLQLNRLFMCRLHPSSPEYKVYTIRQIHNLTTVLVSCSLTATASTVVTDSVAGPILVGCLQEQDTQLPDLVANDTVLLLHGCGANNTAGWRRQSATEATYRRHACCGARWSQHAWQPPTPTLKAALTARRLLLTQLLTAVWLRSPCLQCARRPCRRR